MDTAILLHILFIIAGAGLLYLGGEMLIHNSCRIGTLFKMSPLIIGLTIVAFATSCPELATAIAAAIQGSTDMALGGVIGSNIANLGLILGVTALICPIRAEARFLMREVPFMIGTCILLVLLQQGDLTIDRFDGIILLLITGPYLFILLKGAESPNVQEEFAEQCQASPARLWVYLLGVALGILILVAGAKTLVEGGIGLATAVGISERVIGLTIVAFGTSLPELAGCLVAARRKQADIIMGNLIGSNIFNVLFVLGSTASIRPVPVSDSTKADFAVMLALSVLLLPLMATGFRIGRAKGASLLLYYFAYLIFLGFQKASP